MILLLAYYLIKYNSAAKKNKYSNKRKYVKREKTKFCVHSNYNNTYFEEEGITWLKYCHCIWVFESIS